MLSDYHLYAGERIGTRRHSKIPKLIMALLFWSLATLILLLSTTPLEATESQKPTLAANDAFLTMMHF